MFSLNDPLTVATLIRMTGLLFLLWSIRDFVVALVNSITHEQRFALRIGFDALRRLAYALLLIFALRDPSAGNLSFLLWVFMFVVGGTELLDNVIVRHQQKQAMAKVMERMERDLDEINQRREEEGKPPIDMESKVN